jgi:hypothetical protein
MSEGEEQVKQQILAILYRAFVLLTLLPQTKVTIAYFNYPV